MITLAGIRNALWCSLAFVIVACAAAPLPTEKLEIAQDSIARAEQAQAEQFAQMELDQARHKLAAARTAVEKRDPEKASRMADQADVDAQLAESTARAKHEEQLAADLDASLRDLRSRAIKQKE